MRFEGKVLFTTGAGSGLAEAVSRQFASEGGRVGVADLDGEKAEAVASELEGSIAIQLDAADEGSVRSAVERTASELGRIDCVFNAAGHADFGPVEEWSLERWNRMLGVHAGGTFLSCKYTIPHLRAAGGGSIVNVASIAGLVGLRNRAAYSASKGAVISLTRALAVDHVGDGIRVNAVAPGTVDSPWVRRLVEEVGESLDALRARQPLGRLGTPEEIADAVVYLATAEFVTGSVLVIDGGLTAA
jgi:NAD(P)-dependent dehydrogenase (short-subunit alcohol dehydrogenase family)